MAFIDVYVTFPNMDEARRIVRCLLKKRLIACANVFPIQSMYWWSGRIEESLEVAALLKSRKANWPRLRAEVERLHPYDVPCITRMEASANLGYDRWVREESG
jgi:periplasmic divalent cation tolerance protein